MPSSFKHALTPPEPIRAWSLTNAKEKGIKTGDKLVSRRRYVAFQVAEVAIPIGPFAEMLRLIVQLRPGSPPASA